MVVAQPPLVAGGYRDPYPSGGECLGCAAARADVAALKAEVERIKDHGVSRTEFERHREEVKESLAEDRKVRAEIKTAFDRMAGAKEERARLSALSAARAAAEGRKDRHGDGSDPRDTDGGD
jgi:predicted  nucleic acid-binding Zn-ribbon protein